jgi:hypothetical protein
VVAQLEEMCSYMGACDELIHRLDQGELYATTQPDIVSYINHSANPTAELYYSPHGGGTFSLCYTQALKAGDEITIDYGGELIW